ncbi:hypothetical protein [Persicobacter psychrovividus]|uniref:Uncharacterized protein n=1 Tax=Persicobacter psychrovividus TaxID=387638 RepID=A0ABN6LBM3_9BACT|nr:hypothetical protein PEPS_28100 [Persicobacter psychrovividus]
MPTEVTYNVADIFNPTNYPYFADTIERAQYKINKLDQMTDSLEAKELSSSVKDRKDAESREGLMDKRDTMSAELTVLQQKLADTDAADVDRRVPLQDQITDIERAIEKANFDLRVGEFSENGIRSQLDRKNQEQLVTALKESIVGYCEWIAAGNLGAGSVTYDGNTYTAS